MGCHICSYVGLSELSGQNLAFWTQDVFGKLQSPELPGTRRHHNALGALRGRLSGARLRSPAAWMAVSVWLSRRLGAGVLLKEMEPRSVLQRPQGPLEHQRAPGTCSPETRAGKRVGALEKAPPSSRLRVSTLGATKRTQATAPWKRSVARLVRKQERGKST